MVAEDEDVVRAELRQQLQTLWPELRLVGSASSGLEALQLLEEHAPDVLFLDIEMPGLTGLQVAQQAQGRCHVVFVTAYDSYAVQAFETGAVDYLLKPLDSQRLQSTLARLRARLHEPPANLEKMLQELSLRATPPSYLRWIKASLGDVVKLITVNDVAYFQADNKYTRVVTSSGEALVRSSLQELLRELDPTSFWQIHRGIIVNVAAIHSVYRSFRGTLQVKLKQRPEELPVSATYAERFR